MKQHEKNHYLLMKRKGISPTGRRMSASESAKALLDVGFWPLFKQTPCKNIIQPGQQILIYLAGPDKDCQQVIASVSIGSIEHWSDRKHKAACPIHLDDIPSLVINMTDVKVFERPVKIKERLDMLDLVPKSNPKKWGAALMGGMKTLTHNDYNVLSKVE